MREVLSGNAPLVLAVGGLFIGFLFGAVVFKTNYCAMGSLSDIYNFADYRRFRAWLLAAATALLGAQLLHSFGITALDKSMYLTPSLKWAGHSLGGIIFGIGMVIAGGCPSRNLARAGAGDLRSLMTLVVLGLTAYVTIGGLLGPLRALLERTTAVILPLPGQGLGHLLAAVLQTTPSLENALPAIAPVAASLVVQHLERSFADFVLRGPVRATTAGGRALLPFR